MPENLAERDKATAAAVAKAVKEAKANREDLGDEEAFEELNEKWGL